MIYNIDDFVYIRNMLLPELNLTKLNLNAINVASWTQLF